VWATVGRDEIGPRITTGTAAITALLRADPDHATERLEAGRWSRLEYGAHVRDVLLNVRDRFVVGLVEDHPEFKPLYRDHRVDLGLYRADTVPVVAAELDMAAGLFTRTFAQIDDAALQRTCAYSFPTVETRTLLWMGQQVVHEVEHHRADIER
jgi:hypothetical protein